MRFWRSFLVFLLLVAISKSTTLFLREVLNLKLLSRNEGSEYLSSYAAQRMIALFCKNYSDSPGPALFRATALQNIMEESKSVIKKSQNFEEMIVDKSEGLLGGFLTSVNDGPEHPIEILSLFDENERKTMRMYLEDSLTKEFHVVSFTNTMKVEDWVKVSIAEAVISWKSFHKFFKYVRCDGRVLDLGTDVSELNERLLGLEESIINLDTKMFNIEGKDNALSTWKGNVEARLNLYLNRYEKFLKPRMFKFNFGCFSAKMNSIFSFFQYLHHISRVYAMVLSSTIVERLQREHKDFVNGTIEFAMNVTKTERTLKAALPFDGWYYFTINKGVVVPSDKHTVALSSQYANHKPLVKVSLYYVNFTAWKKFRSAGFSHIREIDENSFELILHTSREGFDEMWLEKLVKQLSRRLTDQGDLLSILNS